MAGEYRVSSRPAVRPAHPGRILRGILRESGIALCGACAPSPGLAANPYAIVNEQRPVSVDMAARLSLAFGNSAQFWLNLQANHDAWDADRAAAEDEDCALRGRCGGLTIVSARPSPPRLRIVNVYGR